MSMIWTIWHVGHQLLSLSLSLSSVSRFHFSHVCISRSPPQVKSFPHDIQRSRGSSASRRMSRTPIRRRDRDLPPPGPWRTGTGTGFTVAVASDGSVTGFETRPSGKHLRWEKCGRIVPAHQLHGRRRQKGDHVKRGSYGHLTWFISRWIHRIWYWIVWSWRFVINIWVEAKCGIWNRFCCIVASSKETKSTWVAMPYGVRFTSYGKK